MGKESVIQTGASAHACKLFTETVDALVIAGIGKAVLAGATAGLQTSVTLHEGQHQGAATMGQGAGKSGSLEV